MSVQTTDTCISYLRSAIANAPSQPGRIAPDLLGWRVGEAGHYVCAPCAGRILARGCNLPPPADPVWAGEAQGECVCHPLPRNAAGADTETELSDRGMFGDY
jgi:hypothetical protein